MKKLLFILVLLQYTLMTGQVGVFSDNPSTAAALEVGGTDGAGNYYGFMPPRLTTVQRNAIPVTATDDGLIIFNTTTECLQFYDGSTWIDLYCLGDNPPVSSGGGGGGTPPPAIRLAESFETDGAGTRYILSSMESSDGGNMYFTRTDGSNIGNSVNFTGSPDGSFFFAVQQFNDAAQTVTFNNIDITAATNFNFLVLLAEDDANNGAENWDNNNNNNDRVIFEYSVDGGAFQNVLAIEATAATGNQSEPSVDANFDGTGDGTVFVTDTWTEFTGNIAAIGATLDLRITIRLNQGNEDIAIDNIRIIAN